MGDEETHILVTLSVEVPSPIDERFTETHYHRYVDLAPDMDITASLVDQYRDLGGAKIDIMYLDHVPPTHPPVHAAGLYLN